MALTGYLYVSVSRLRLPQDEALFDQVIEHSRVRNQLLDVTGCLLWSGDRFAQYLEGPGHGIDQLMASIRMDRRHRDVTTLHHGTVMERRFEEWSMGYSGPSNFAARHIEQATSRANSGGRIDSAEALIRLMEEFARSDP